MLVGLLIAAVLLVNLPYLTLNWMYPEEPLMYVANQQIHSLKDLLNVYLHPQLFHPSIPFFRPSGHFLMYQLTTPFIGWHHPKVFMAINFIFLALTGYYLIRLYGLLFGGYWIGGLIGFAIYAAHPSLFLVKIIVLHFEFAQTLFVALTFYYFFLFCQQNITNEYTIRIKNITPLLLAFAFYFIAMTFKESAIMAGPVCMMYLLIQLNQNEQVSHHLRRVMRDKKTLEFILLFGVALLMTAMYLSSAWPNMRQAQINSQSLSMAGVISGINGFLFYILNWHLFTLAPYQQLYFGAKIYFSLLMSVIILLAIGFTISAMIMLFKNKTAVSFKKSVIFLAVASLCFLVLPVGWGLGYPWHYNLALMMLALLVGFSVEYVFRQCYLTQLSINVAGVLIALTLGVTATATNMVQANNLKGDMPPLYAAVMRPPLMSGALNNNSLVIVGDSIERNAYALGAASYPCRLYYQDSNKRYILAALSNQFYFYHVSPDFDASLFRMAYLLPGMKEQVVPYQVDHLEQVNPSLLYQWLQHYDDIHFLTYDNQGNWYDLTKQFKQSILAEKQRRHLQVRNYRRLSDDKVNAKPLRMVMLPGNLETDCQYFCDTEAKCNTYRFARTINISRCELYR